MAWKQMAGFDTRFTRHMIGFVHYQLLDPTFGIKETSQHRVLEFGQEKKVS